MDIIEAIKSRYSVRAYKPDPVPKKVLQEILEASLRAPSWANTQTWEFAVIGGTVMEELKHLLATKAMEQHDRYPDIPRPEWPSPYQERRRELGAQIYRILGIARDDLDKELQWFVQMYSFFGAPNAIIVYTDRGLSEWALFNIGLVVQTIALAALNYGLGTAILASVVSYPGEVRSLLDIPDTKQLVVGLAIGYPDPEAEINQFRSSRVPLESVTRWYGFS